MDFFHLQYILQVAISFIYVWIWIFLGTDDAGKRNPLNLLSLFQIWKILSKGKVIITEIMERTSNNFLCWEKQVILENRINRHNSNIVSINRMFKKFIWDMDNIEFLPLKMDTRYISKIGVRPNKKDNDKLSQLIFSQIII